MKNAIIKWYSLLAIVILAVGCAGPEPAAQFSVKWGTVISAMPGSGVPSSIGTAMRTATKVRATGLLLGELKYRLLEKYPNFFFCDPDVYPLYRPRAEQEHALARFPEIEKDTAIYQAILKHTNGLTIEGTITKTGEITVSKSEPTILQCPKCLATNTLIDTPGGPRDVQDLQEGMSVWTLDVAGQRVAARVIRTTRVRVPTTHQVVRLRLDDGRQVLGSPGHPTADGRTLAQLQPGDALDGAQVLSAKRIRYADDYTYDILPSGSTGAYWANGILLGSTLRLHVASQRMRPDGNILQVIPNKGK